MPRTSVLYVQRRRAASGPRAASELVDNGRAGVVHRLDDRRPVVTRGVLVIGAVLVCVNQTAILHIAATGAVGAGIVVSGQTLTAGLLILGLLLFVIGAVIARRDGDDSETDAGFAD